MEKSLSKAISTALTAAAKEAVDAHVKQVSTAAIDKAVRKQANELDHVFAAAVDSAVQKHAKKLQQTFSFAVDSAVKKQMDEIEAVIEESTDARLARAVRKTQLQAMIYEAKTMDYVEAVAGHTFPDIWTFWNQNGDPRRNMARWERELAELDKVQERKV